MAREEDAAVTEMEMEMETDAQGQQQALAELDALQEVCALLYFVSGATATHTHSSSSRALLL